MQQQRSVGRQFVVIATIYLMASLALGFAMGVTGDHSLFSIHSHLGLLGWTTMALTGIVYLVLPACGSSVLARVHFWLHNLGLPLMLGGLTAITLTGNSRVEPAVGLGSALVVVALLVFTVNVLRNGRAPAPAERPAPSVGG